MKVSNNYFGYFNGGFDVLAKMMSTFLNNDSFNWISEEERGDLFSDFALHKKPISKL